MTPDTNADPKHRDHTDDAGFATPETKTFERDPETGELAGEVNYVEELQAKVEAKPLNKDARKKYLQPLLEEGDGAELEDALLADMFDSHIIRPDLTEHPRLEGDNVTERFVREELEEDGELGYFFAILLASGKEELVENFRKALSGEIDPDDLEDTEDGEEGN